MHVLFLMLKSCNASRTRTIDVPLWRQYGRVCVSTRGNVPHGPSCREDRGRGEAVGNESTGGGARGSVRCVVGAVLRAGGPGLRRAPQFEGFADKVVAGFRAIRFPHTVPS